ncbi:MAG: guanylate kinase, partial [Candidatus Puniceispirillaceae bacterium]
FKTDVNKGLFLEYAQVFDHYYGTPLRPVQDTLAAGGDVLFDIDWQGTQQIKAKAREDLVSVFVLPPSTAELERRLLSRAQDSAEVVAGRMARAADEMSHYPEYDYIIVNHDLEASIEAVHTILKAERLRISRQAGLTDFMKQLREDSRW